MQVFATTNPLNHIFRLNTYTEQKKTRFFPIKRNEHKHLHNKNKTTTKLLKNPSNTIITFVQLLWVRILETLLCTTLNIKYIRYNLVYTSVKLLYQHDYFNKYKDLLSIGSYKNQCQH